MSAHDWEWDDRHPERFNPMDAATHARIDIAVLQAVDALRMFVTGQTGMKLMDNDEFAALLKVAAASARRAGY